MQALDYIPTEHDVLTRQLIEGEFKKGKAINTIIRKNNLIEHIRDTLGYTEFYEHVLTTIGFIKQWGKTENSVPTNKLVTNKKHDIIHKNRTHKQWQQLYDGIKFMNNLSTSRGSHYIAVVYSGNSFQKTNLVGNLIAWLNNNNIDYIDLDTDIARYNIADYGFSCDYHWNEITHKTVAKILAKKIKAKIINRNLIGH